MPKKTSISTSRFSVAGQNGKYLDGMMTRCPCGKLVSSFHIVKTPRPPMLFAFACDCGAQFAREVLPV